MILAIDIGNSNIVFGCIEGRDIKHTFRIVTDARKTEYEYAFTIKSIFDFSQLSLSDIEGAIISTVVPSLAGVMKNAVTRLTGLAPMLVGAGMKTGMNIKLDNPAQLGADLVCGAVAVIADYSLPAIVFDMGTGTTISVIDKDANYLGGAIFPGLALSMSALTSRSSLLPNIEIEPPEKVISTNTIDCLKSGAIFGTASMVDGMIDRVEAELGMKATVIATGGLASKVIPYCRHEITVNDELLLRGLAVLYEKNSKPKKSGLQDRER